MYEYKAKILNVIDGDTIDVEVDLGFALKYQTRVRLARINAPEQFGIPKNSVEYEKGVAATKFVQDFAKMTNDNVRVVTLKNKAKKFGEYFVEVFALEGPFKDKNLNDEMLIFGFAKENDHHE